MGNLGEYPSTELGQFNTLAQDWTKKRTKELKNLN